MFGIADFGAFCLAVLVFLALPGPGTFALLNSTGKGGFRAGAAATFRRNAVQYMNRGVTYDEFCRRCERQGRSEEATRFHDLALRCWRRAEVKDFQAELAWLRGGIFTAAKDSHQRTQSAQKTDLKTPVQSDTKQN